MSLGKSKLLAYLLAIVKYQIPSRLRQGWDLLSSWPTFFPNLVICYMVYLLKQWLTSLSFPSCEFQFFIWKEGIPALRRILIWPDVPKALSEQVWPALAICGPTALAVALPRSAGLSSHRPVPHTGPSRQPPDLHFSSSVAEEALSPCFRCRYSFIAHNKHRKCGAVLSPHEVQRS